MKESRVIKPGKWWIVQIRRMESYEQITGYLTCRNAYHAGHQGQLDLALTGWKRDLKAADYLNGSHNVEKAVWKKRFPKEKAPRFISAFITTRFGIYAVFVGAGCAGNIVLDVPNRV